MRRIGTHSWFNRSRLPHHPHLSRYPAILEFPVGAPLLFFWYYLPMEGLLILMTNIWIPYCLYVFVCRRDCSFLARGIFWYLLYLVSNIVKPYFWLQPILYPMYSTAFSASPWPWDASATDPVSNQTQRLYKSLRQYKHQNSFRLSVQQLLCRFFLVPTQIWEKLDVMISVILISARVGCYAAKHHSRARFTVIFVRKGGHITLTST